MCARVYACFNMCVCVYSWLCECVVTGFVNVATLIYSSVMGHNASCLVHEVALESQNDP